MTIFVSMSGLDWSWAEKPKTKKKAAKPRAVVSRRTKKTAFKSLAQQYAEIHGECR